MIEALFAGEIICLCTAAKFNNADFDGEEMDVHGPQDGESQSELFW